VIRLLEKKNFRVVYENMLVLPANCLIKTPDEVASALIKLLPHRAEEMTEAILTGEKRRCEPKVWDLVMSHWGKAYEQGAKTFGSNLVVSGSCTLCGRCVENCPAGNIAIDQGGIHFADRCHACLSCIYGCPEHALTPRTWKSLLLKEGYDLDKWGHQELRGDSSQLKKQIKGLLWIGVRRYLHTHYISEEKDLFLQGK
jgi:ferredoxin